MEIVSSLQDTWIAPIPQELQMGSCGPLRLISDAGIPGTVSRESLLLDLALDLFSAEEFPISIAVLCATEDTQDVVGKITNNTIANRAPNTRKTPPRHP